MRSLDVSLCAGDIGKTSVNSMKMSVCGIGKRNVFEVVASAGAGDIRFAMNLWLKQKWSFDVFDYQMCDRSRQQGLR